MADYGADVNVPNNSGPGQLTSGPSNFPQEANPPSAPQGHPFNEDALNAAFDKIPAQQDVQRMQAASQQPGAQASGTPTQWSGVNAIGTPSQIAQASIGRNTNERLQIWSKLVGDENAMIGPTINGQNDVWIRGQDKKFHPADTGHTDFMQDLAKKTGAGIDVVTQGVAALAGAAGGLALGSPAVGAALGYAMGPGASSAGRQFLESRLYGVKPDPEQFKRDLYIGGALNLFMGGVMQAGSNMVANAAEAVAESPGARISKLADAQISAKKFMDSVGASPVQTIDESGEINAPMMKSGERLWSATQLKRQQLNDLIGSANDQIIAASPDKVPTQPLAQAVKEFMQKDGYKFNDQGMPVPYQNVPLGYEAVPSDLESKYFLHESDIPVANVSEARLNRPKMGTEAMNDLAEDYKALQSGQMDTKSFLQTIRDWQENAKFKPLDERSDATRSGWAQLQHVATSYRQQVINNTFKNDPDMLGAINNAYHEYSSTKDAIDMIYNQYAKNGNSPELLSKVFFQPGKKELLSQAQSLFADRPDIMKDLRGSWLSEKMGKFVGSDGVFDSNGFIKDLRKTGGETLSQVFQPGELADLYRSAKIMGSVKSGDIVSQEQGKNFTEAVASMAEQAHRVSLNQPSTWLNLIQNKPKLADYMTSPEGLSKIASTKDPATAKILSGLSTVIKNKFVQAGAQEAVKQSSLYKNINPFGIAKPVTPPPQGYKGSDAAADQVFGSGQ
jgi:hypothetical protein